MAIFDAEPLVAVLLGEPGGLVSGRVLADKVAEHAICALNAAEVVNIVARRSASEPRDVVDGVSRWLEAGLQVVALDWARAQLVLQRCAPSTTTARAVPSRWPTVGRSLLLSSSTRSSSHPTRR